MTTIGWREWVALPDLGVSVIKAKVDTGARTSSLHTAAVEPFVHDGRQRVRFRVHPNQQSSDEEVICEADVLDFRRITNSGGESEHRYVIRTRLQVGEKVWPVEVSLASRPTMTFRMLLGRTALRGHLLVDTGRSYVTGRMRNR